MSISHAQRGRKGGRATLRKYGHEHMSRIGKRGAAATHARYSIQPAAVAMYYMVDRNTGKVIACLNGNQYLDQKG